MPSSATAKTAWVHRRKIALACLAAFLLLAAFSLLSWWYLKSDGHRLQAGSAVYHVDIASTGAEQERGLGGRTSMPQARGMLFVFANSGKRCIWMKDMNFSIDVLWLDAQKRVVDIYEHMSPRTYPRSFCAADPARYVVELNAGQVKASGIAVGQTLRF